MSIYNCVIVFCSFCSINWFAKKHVANIIIVVGDLGFFLKKPLKTSFMVEKPSVGNWEFANREQTKNCI